MATAEKSKVSFDWTAEELKAFDQTIARLKGEGEIPSDVKRSEAIRVILRDWTDEPDASLFDA